MEHLPSQKSHFTLSLHVKHIMCLDSENMTSDLGGKDTENYLEGTHCNFGLPSTLTCWSYSSRKQPRCLDGHSVGREVQRKGFAFSIESQREADVFMVFKCVMVECREDRGRLFPALGKGAKIPSYNTNSEKILQKIFSGRYWNRLSKKH